MYANFNKQNNFNRGSNFNGADNTNVQNNFLGEMRELLNSLKTMVEGQKQSGHAIVFPSQQPQGQQPPSLLPYVSPGTQFIQTSYFVFAILFYIPMKNHSFSDLFSFIVFDCYGEIRTILS